MSVVMLRSILTGIMRVWKVPKLGFAYVFQSFVYFAIIVVGVRVLESI